MKGPSEVDLPLDLESLRRRASSGETFKYLYFWGHTPRPGRLGLECCSQWYEAPFMVDGMLYRTAEHWMMSGKARLFGDLETDARITAAKSPAEAKALGREVKNFNDEAWNANRFEIVVSGNVAKFSQHPALTEFLLNTGRRILVEASPRDRIWGVGLGAQRAEAEGPNGWRGLNLLGFALVAARARIMAQSA